VEPLVFYVTADNVERDPAGEQEAKGAGAKDRLSVEVADAIGKFFAENATDGGLPYPG
jgi:hypothetical protein